MDKKGKNNENEKSTLQALGFVSGIGISFAVTIGICLYAGIYIDQHFATGPIATICGIILGFLTAIWTTYQKLLGKNK